MMGKSKIWLGLGALLAGLGAPLDATAAVFVPPAENVVVFRRDRLPIDVESMAELSGHLLTMAKAHGGKSSAQRHAVARMLALAAALQPASAPVRDFAAAYAGGKRDFGVGESEARAACRRVREMLGWLDESDANDDARALAACLKDVLAAADPTHPDSEKHLASGEQGPWQGWVEPVAAFRTRDSQSPGTTSPDAKTAPASVVDPSARKPPTPSETLAVKLPEASLLTIAWTADQPGATRELRPIILTMKAGARPPPEATADDDNREETDDRDAEPPGFSCGWQNPGAMRTRSSPDDDEARQLDWRRFQEVATTAVSAAESLLGTLPKDTQAVFAPGGKLVFRADRDPAVLSAPLAVLLHAAFAGNPPRGAVIASVRADGSLDLPPDFWLRLRALPPAGVGRLVLPSAADAYLPSFLALEIPEVFFHNEVLLADDLNDLIALSTGQAGAAVSEASAGFQEIRAEWAGKPVGPFVNNRTVRQRLDDIAHRAPGHASARMLAIQGAAQRPTKLPKPILAAELLNITRRTDWVAQAPTTEDLKSTDLQAIVDTARPLITALDRYTDMRDRDLNDAASDILVALRTFGRALRKTTDAEGNWVDRYSDLQAFRTVHKAMTDKLRAAAATPP